MTPPLTEKSALESLLLAGCHEFVICGGARNAGLAALLTSLPDIQTWQHFEERGAAFFALGCTKDHNHPTAVVTTSGTAVAECLPAVIEAYYTQKPLIILSADRPETFRGSGAPQTIEQENIFGSYAHTDLQTWNKQQPLHLNLPLEESTPDTQNWHPSSEAFISPKHKFNVTPLRNFLDDGGTFKGLIAVIGGLEPEDREETFHFIKDLGIPTIADINSGIRETLGDQLIPEQSLHNNHPGRILRLGEVPVGRLWRDLEHSPQTEVLSICRNGLPGLARPSQVIQGEVARVLRGLGSVQHLGDIRDDLPKARQHFNQIDEQLEAHPDSEPGLINLLSTYATTGESLYLGNSLPIRHFNQYAQRQTPYARVLANRGANGIDGQLSTWLGATTHTPDAWGVFGDLTTLYDLAAPALLSQIEQQGRTLVVINNNGGRIFDHLPRLNHLTPKQKKPIIQPHTANLQAWAEMWQIDYLKITSQEDFDHLEPREKTLVVEIIPSPSS